MPATVAHSTPLFVQLGPDADVTVTTWGDFCANNGDAFTGDELAALADLMSEGELVLAGMAMIWIEVDDSAELRREHRSLKEPT